MKLSSSIGSPALVINQAILGDFQSGRRTDRWLQSAGHACGRSPLHVLLDGPPRVNHLSVGSNRTSFWLHGLPSALCDDIAFTTHLATPYEAKLKVTPKKVYESGQVADPRTTNVKFTRHGYI